MLLRAVLQCKTYQHQVWLLGVPGLFQQRDDRNVKIDNPWNASVSPKEQLPEMRSGWTSRDTDSDSNFSLNFLKLLSSTRKRFGVKAAKNSNSNQTVELDEFPCATCPSMSSFFPSPSGSRTPLMLESGSSEPGLLPRTMMARAHVYWRLGQQAFVKLFM